MDKKILLLSPHCPPSPDNCLQMTADWRFKNEKRAELCKRLNALRGHRLKNDIQQTRSSAMEHAVVKDYVKETFA